jgi:hypothetical protein
LGNSSNPKEQAVPDSHLLSRRNRSLFLPTQQYWNDHRAWIASTVFHTLFFLVVGLLWKPQSRGTGGDRETPIGIALVHETNQGNEYFLSGGSGKSGQTETSSPETTKIALPTDGVGPPISIDAILSEMVGSNTGGTQTQGADAGVGAGLSGNGKSSGNGSGLSRGNGSKTKTTFFGVEGTGASFVYVVDRSDSMNVYDAGPLSAAKREIRKSIDSFQEHHQFQIVFYNDSLSPLTQDKRMLFATDADKARAQSFVSAMRGDGGTEHMAALKLGLTFAPEVLFFLTDAEHPSLNSEQLADLQRRAERGLTTIHAIQFNVGPAVGTGGWIRRLAEMNRGTYKYIDVTQLTP